MRFTPIEWSFTLLEVNSVVCSLAFLNAWEIVLILAVVMLFFGVKKLPGLAKGLGQGIKEFRTAVREDESKSNSVEKK